MLRPLILKMLTFMEILGSETTLICQIWYKGKLEGGATVMVSGIIVLAAF